MKINDKILLCIAANAKGKNILLMGRNPGNFDEVSY